MVALIVKGKVSRRGSFAARSATACISGPRWSLNSTRTADCSPEEYFQHHSSLGKIALGQELAAFAESVLGRPGSMLELGCGRGELLRGAASRGWSVRGVEMTEAFARIASEEHGVEIERAPIESAQSLEAPYGVVLLAAILEHLYDPAETLKRVRGALRPDGLVFIDVPNECSFMSRVGNAYMRLRAKDWAINLSPTFSPFHVVGFCPISLRYLLGRTGFHPIKLELHRWKIPLPSTDGYFRGAGAGGPQRGVVARKAHWDGGRDDVLGCSALKTAGRCPGRYGRRWQCG